MNTYIDQHTTATTNPSEYFARHIIQLAGITDDLSIAQKNRFIVKPNLLKILRTEIKNQDKEKIIFAYITRRKNLLFLPNNQLVARVDLDPPLKLALGGIKRMHRAQTSKMIWEQLIPVSEEPELKLITEYGD